MRWSGRLLLLLASCELTLRLGSAVVPRLVVDANETSGAIVCIGDSNTFGIGAPEGRSYPDQLREMLSAAGSERAVVNLGIAGLESGRAVDRLASALEQTPPACVLFLAGVNDYNNNVFLLPLDTTATGRALARVRSLLRHSATYRFAETAVNVLRGDFERCEFGAAPQEVADPDRVELDRFEVDYPAERARGADSIHAWLVKAWELERPDLAGAIWSDFSALPRFDEIVRRWWLPREAYEWELARLRGERLPPVPPGDDDLAISFARFTEACAAIDRGDFSAARHSLEAAAQANWDLSFRAFAALHEAWIPLLTRDYGGAAEALSRGVDEIARLETPVGKTWGVGGAALAIALSSESASLEAWRTARHDLWMKTHWYRASPAAREWTCAADLVEAAKLGDARLKGDALWYRKNWVGTPTTAPLKWLTEHPVATFTEIREGLPLEPPRAGFLGPRHRFLKQMSDDELVLSVGRSADRLAALAGDGRFEVVALTYLDPDAQQPSDAMRGVAANNGWPLVDLQKRYSRDELIVDDKARYFGIDRHHPNEAGYGLVARAVLDVLREHRIVP